MAYHNMADEVRVGSEVRQFIPVSAGTVACPCIIDVLRNLWQGKNSCLALFPPVPNGTFGRASSPKYC